MQNMVKDFNYRRNIVTGDYKIYYLDNDFTIKVYKTYEIIGDKITDVYNSSVDIRILDDIQELTKLGFRFNPYLVDNTL